MGGISHPILDGIVHRDVHPFMPFSNYNPFLGLLGPGRIEVICMAAAALGVVALRINSGSRQNEGAKTQPISVQNR